MRGELLQLIMNGEITGMGGMGCRRITWLRNIREWAGFDVQAVL